MKNTLLKLWAVAAFLLLCGPAVMAQRKAIEPSQTLCFAHKDGADLLLDIYQPASGSQTTVGKMEKPTILFMFGGGFIGGSRRDSYFMGWFEKLVSDGYRVVSIDYRLGLKGAGKMGIMQASKLQKAINMAVEDLFSATAYLVKNAAKLGIDPANIVVSGSSAGAITALEAEWYICNDDPICKELPKDFNYAGVMSFSGAIYSSRGSIKFKKEPAPMLLMHGKTDKIVNYGQIWFFNLRWAGTKVIARSLKKGGYDYQVYRFEDYGHEISTEMLHQYDKEVSFLLDNVMGRKKVKIDATIDDQTIFRYKNLNKLDDLYGRN